MPEQRDNPPPPPPAPGPAPAPAAARPEPHLPLSPWGLSGLPGVIANLGAVGVLCWFLWFAVSVQLPALQRGFHDELRQERELFRQELRDSREHQARQTEMVVKAVADQQQLVRDTLRAVQDTQKLVADLVFEVRRKSPGGSP